jgi:CRP-like cAMP-binding protein
LISTVEKVLFLKSIDLFAQISAEDLALVALIASEEKREANEEIFSEGEPGDALYLILSGKVRIVKGETIIAELGSRECFGEMSILDASARSAAAWTTETTKLLRIGREEFSDILAEKASIAIGIIRVLSDRLRLQLEKTPSQRP